MSHPEEDRLARELAPTLAALDLIVEEVRAVAAGSRRTLTVTVDLADGEATEPVSMDQIAEATRALDGKLEALDVFGGKPFTLEVSSPGATRDLEDRRHFTRVVGRKLALKTNDGHSLVARLRGVGEEQGEDFTLDLHDEKRDEVLSVARSELTRARVELEFK